MRLPSMLALLGAAALASAARLTVSIPPSPPVLPNPAALPPSTHATLIGAPGNKHSAIIRRDNTIVFENLPEDSYLLAVHTRDHFFPPYRVDIGHAESNPGQEIVQVWQTFRGNEWSNKGPLLAQGDSNLRVDVRPAATKEYYQQRGGFNLIGFLKSPMILMGLFSVVMIFGMPYLMENMDPETKAEFEDMQKNSPLSGSNGAADKIQNFDLAGFLSGKPNSGVPAGSGQKR